MRKSIGILFVTLIGFGLIDLAPAKDVMNDQLLSLVRSYNQLENKLERHEYRERALGELLKKGIMSLQIGQKSMEPMKGIFSRLDERVSQIETLLMAQEQKYSLQSEKIDEVIKLIKWMDENSKKNSGGSSVVIKEPVVVEAPMNLEMLKEVRTLSGSVQKLLDMSSSLMKQTEEMAKQSPKTEQLIDRMENKLVSLYVPPPSTTQAPIIIDNSEFESKVMDSFKSIASNINELKSYTPTTQGPAGLVQADKEFIQALTNETLNALENLKIDTLSATDKVLAKASSRIKDSEANVDSSIKKVNENIENTTEILEKFYVELNATHNALTDGLDNFNKILLSNSDEILKTQRKIEFGTHQIGQKISDVVGEEQLKLQQEIKKRFDDVDESISTNHVQSLQNISSAMETEISQVWHQIEIMHSEMSDSKDAMNKLTGQTEVYVNGTFATMDGMEGKVSQITSRMMEVDSNLNYLLGRLSLITQEFNQIKTGLGDALEQIRGSFHEISEKVVNPGPGPHNIPRNEYETDFNLLSKRNAS
ncbi:uncharacterized protein LOC129905328 [Episyrphus balteatus]|uniref:uncharacterized protein LOC129905328 n=1 Tax=Episyrphus balteatus TaxID=286459 RepID=UPI002485CB9E|nr:uncharacterized protein LOC129905328 [Episyrphus balteatus]